MVYLDRGVAVDVVYLDRWGGCATWYNWTEGWRVVNGILWTEGGCRRGILGQMGGCGRGILGQRGAVNHVNLDRGVAVKCCYTWTEGWRWQWYTWTEGGCGRVYLDRGVAVQHGILGQRGGGGHGILGQRGGCGRGILGQRVAVDVVYLGRGVAVQHGILGQSMVWMWYIWTEGWLWT
ncbi:unnamed protein product [Staurois parvus]|uniref:Uncharacterized protein n=1 Tax=Staurois parvus TaxID=386267 RepID=A0ABN9FA00_9NEOB|nr:unnamed protein product [Staurois parvus]